MLGCSCIPTKGYHGCWEVVKQCVIRWTSVTEAAKMNPTFQNELNGLLDLRFVSQSLDSIFTQRDYVKGR